MLFFLSHTWGRIHGTFRNSTITIISDSETQIMCMKSISMNSLIKILATLLWRGIHLYTFFISRANKYEWRNSSSQYISRCFFMCCENSDGACNGISYAFLVFWLDAKHLSLGRKTNAKFYSLSVFIFFCRWRIWMPFMRITNMLKIFVFENWAFNNQNMYI